MRGWVSEQRERKSGPQWGLTEVEIHIEISERPVSVGDVSRERRVSILWSSHPHCSM